jgi:hypothetical protein
MSFLQEKALMIMKEKLGQEGGAIRVNRREIAHARLEKVAGEDNPSSLISKFCTRSLKVKAGRGEKSH